MVKGKHYFEGEVWVDDRDLQIVKTYGKGAGSSTPTNQFPKFETYREQIDGKYWFPTYTHADDTLHFKEMSQRIRLVVKYQDYKRFEGRSTIKYGGVVDDKNPSGTARDWSRPSFWPRAPRAYLPAGWAAFCVFLGSPRRSRTKGVTRR